MAMLGGVRVFFRRASPVLGAAILVLAVVSAVLAPRIASHDPNRQDIGWRLKPPGSVKVDRGSNLLGTDQLGRDVFSRILHGTRASLFIALSSVAFALGLGILSGLSAGYYGGVLDVVLMRLVDLQMAFPFILLALAVLSLWGPTTGNLVGLFALTGWPVYARTIRGSVLPLRSSTLVESARAIGLRDLRILATYVLPNCLAPVIVLAAFEVGRVILTESALGFLGLGVQPPTPTWGTMVADGREYIRTAWWLITFPGVAIIATVWAVGSISDAMRDFLDPRSRAEGGGRAA